MDKVNGSTKYGVEVKDKITGFKGILIGKAVYMFGCATYLVCPKVDKTNQHHSGNWFDEGRLEIIGNGINPKEVISRKPGGGIPAPTK